MPKEKYSRAPEILAHSRAIGEQFDLYRDALLPDRGRPRCAGTRARARWIVSTNRGDRMRARFVVMANGPLHRPKLPGIPGIETFRGHTFHTSRWDYDYTGGDSNGGLDRARRQARRHHRHRRHRRAVRAAPRRGGEAALRLPAHAVVDRRARTTARPIPRGRRASSPAGSRQRMDNFNTLVSGGFAGGGPGAATAGPTSSASCSLALHRGRTPDLSPEGLAKTMETGRLREDGADPRAGRRARRGPARPPRR